MLWRGSSGRWEICVSNWSDLWGESVIKYRDMEINLDAPHKAGECDDLTKFLTNSRGLWATVAEDEEHKLPRLLGEHTACMVYNYGDLLIVCPKLWNKCQAQAWPISLE